MPNIVAPAAPIVEAGGFSVTLMDANGKTSNTGLDGFDASVTLAQLQTWASAVGRSSNAAVIAEINSQSRRISKGSARPYDEAESSVASKGVLVFENAALKIKEVNIPAPDLAWFSSGIAIQPDYGAASNPATPAQVLGQLITATLTILNAGTPAGTFAYLKGYVQTPGRKSPVVPVIVTTEEPAAADEPGPEPGV